MADEYTINLTLELKKGNFKHSFRPSTITPDLAGSYFQGSVQAVQTSAYEALFVGDAGNGGITYLYNPSTSTTTDPSFNIALASSTSTPFLTLLPNEFAYLRNVTTAMSAIGVSTNAGGNYQLQIGIFDA